MKNNKYLAITGKAFIAVWSLVCLVIFMYFPGAISQIYGVSFYNAPSIVENYSRISIAFFLDTLISFLGMIFYGIACTSLGLRIATFFHLGENSYHSHHTLGITIPISFLIGNAAFSLLFLFTASLFSITKLYSAIILSFGLLSGFGQFKLLSLPTILPKTWYEKIVISLLLAILTLALFQSSARISYDSASTYFSYAKLSALKYHIDYFLDNTFVVSISQATIIYAVMIQLFGDQSARLISWLFGVATIWLGTTLTETIGGTKSAQRILPVLIVTSTAFIDLMGDGKVDLFSSAYSLSSIYWFINAVKVRQDKKRTLFIFSGCLTGFACILRPQNVFLIGAFVVSYSLLKLRTKYISRLQFTRQIYWMILGACGFAFYHLVINWIVVGTPLAFLSVLTKINPTDGPWDYNPNVVWVYRLFYPLVITFKNSGASLGNISPLIVAFLPLLMSAPIRRHINLKDDAAEIYIATVIVLFSWVILIFTVVEVRYVFFLWIILFIPISEIIAGMFESPSITLRWVSVSCVILIMVFILIRSFYISLITYSPIDEEGNPRCYNSALCNQFEAANKYASPGERVLVLSPFRYYLRSDLFACSTSHEDYRRLQTASQKGNLEFWDEVYRQGYKYIIYDKNYAALHLELAIIPDPNNAPNWIKLEAIFGNPGDSQVTYKIIASNSFSEIGLSCLQDSSNNWTIIPATP